MMSAIEMFETLGYECRKSENAIQYLSECGKEITFIFLIRRFYKQENFKSLNISVDEFKAIQQQMKELGWLEKEEIAETNYEHFKDEILEDYSQNLAVVKGRPTQCYKTNCNDCDFKINQIGCRQKAKDWLKQTHIKPTYKLTQCEYDMLDTIFEKEARFSTVYFIGELKKKGYFKNIKCDSKVRVKDIIANCEVVG